MLHLKVNPQIASDKTNASRLKIESMLIWLRGTLGDNLAGHLSFSSVIGARFVVRTLCLHNLSGSISQQSKID
jgi:hypothetical protein